VGCCGAGRLPDCLRFLPFGGIFSQFFPKRSYCGPQVLSYGVPVRSKRKIISLVTVNGIVILSQSIAEIEDGSHSENEAWAGEEI